MMFTIVFSNVICQYDADNQRRCWHTLLCHKWYWLLSDNSLASSIDLAQILGMWWCCRGSEFRSNTVGKYAEPLLLERRAEKRSYEKACINININVITLHYELKIYLNLRWVETEPFTYIGIYLLTSYRLLCWMFKCVQVQTQQNF